MSRCGSFVARALVLPVPLVFRLFRVQGDSRLSQVRELPLYAHAPVYDPGGVPPACHIALGTAAFQVVKQCRLSPLYADSPFGPPVYLFRDSMSRPAHSLPLCFAHPLSGIALRFRYSPAGYALAWRDSHPLGNINRFQCLYAPPNVSRFTWHDNYSGSPTVALPLKQS